MNDLKIIEIFFTEKSNRRSYLKLIDSNEEIKIYLDNRFKDSPVDYNEILWRIKLGYEEVPLCPVCKTEKIKFFGTSLRGYSQTCSKKCRDILWHEKQVKTVKEKYGVENCFQAEICKEKIKQIWTVMVLNRFCQVLKLEKNMHR